MITPFWFTVYFSITVALSLMGAGYAIKEENGGKFFGYLIVTGMYVWAIFSMFEILKTCK